MPLLPYLFPPPETWKDLPPRSSPAYRRGVLMDLSRIGVGSLIVGGLLAVGFAEVIDARDEPRWLNLETNASCNVEGVTKHSAAALSFAVTIEQPAVGTKEKKGTSEIEVMSPGQIVLFGGGLPEVEHSMPGDSNDEFSFDVRQLREGDKTYTVYLRHEMGIGSRIDGSSTTTEMYSHVSCGDVSIGVHDGNIETFSVH